MPEKSHRRMVDAAVSFLKLLIIGRRREEEVLPLEEDKEEQNPFLPQLREILEEILKKRKISYEQFTPVMIDGGRPEETVFAAELLSRDLNHLIILTDQPAYFEECADNMYEEQGLIAEIFSKSKEKIEETADRDFYGNVILDFEEKEKKSLAADFRNKIYIPIFKRRWEYAGNLDIAVPIGYNTMIVRGRKTKEQRYCLDKFERAFYENE